MAERSTSPRPAASASQPANPNQLAIGQSAVVGATAALFLRGVTEGPWVLLGVFVGLHVLLLAGAAALLALTYLLGTLTRHGSRLTESPGLRCAWTLIVWAAGTALVAYGKAALGQFGFEPDRHPEAGHWLLGLAVTLVVGLLSRGPRVRAGSGVLIALFVLTTAAQRAAT
ncbi:hypothetical protein O7598_27575 [Micromonospora sp. WMMC241]|uniref:hypothetical protein n=1 Tax=Micromonospora sp. WMMC241 TaxID=3015159 RepID=UPI0022B63C89|nr:hypothetical protein [Micromonospora sp. WMMC241]MCZ7440192.1 hypothetical protein [Micromonospora sp. WMMC241]